MHDGTGKSMELSPKKKKERRKGKSMEQIAIIVDNNKKLGGVHVDITFRYLHVHLYNVLIIVLARLLWLLFIIHILGNRPI